MASSESSKSHRSGRARPRPPACTGEGADHLLHDVPHTEGVQRVAACGEQRQGVRRHLIQWPGAGLAFLPSPVALPNATTGAAAVAGAAAAARRGVGRGVGRLPCTSCKNKTSELPCALRVPCAHRTPYGGKQTARGARRQRRSARAARATEGRSSDRWRCRCSVCPGAPSARGARQERGQAWRRGDTRLRRRAGERSVRGEAAGEGAAGDGAREQPTPDASL